LDDSSCSESDGLCSASVSTDASRNGSFIGDDSFRHMSMKKTNCVAVQPSRWEDALVQAQRAAENYFKEKLLGQQQHERNAKQEKKKQPKGLPTGLQQLVDDLRRKHDAFLICETLATDTESPFFQFCWKFMELHGALICENLRRLFNTSFNIRLAALNCDVASTFMKACQGGLVGKLRPAYHGTNENNLPSIYRQGLLIPGQNNGIKVANGSAYGLGIYTADVTNPHLSWGYARGGFQKLLICGVIDDVGHSTAPEVKHAGSALVVFNADRVAPLFEATVRNLAPPQPQPPAHKPSFAAALAALRVAALEKPTRQKRNPHRHRCPAPEKLTHVAKFLARRAARRRRQVCVA